MINELLKNLNDCSESFFKRLTNFQTPVQKAAAIRNSSIKKAQNYQASNHLISNYISEEELTMITRCANMIRDQAAAFFLKNAANLKVISKQKLLQQIQNIGQWNSILDTCRYVEFDEFIVAPNNFSEDSYDDLTSGVINDFNNSIALYSDIFEIFIAVNIYIRSMVELENHKKIGVII